MCDSALKAFIAARKPRNLEVRSRKTASYTGGDRGAQESSSSSADTGELQTPSPQYSEAIPASNDRVIATRDSDDEKVIFSESMDPHFARLLNSLSLSAAQNIDLKPSHTADGAPPLPEHSLPSNRLQTPDWSSRVPSYTDTSPVKSPGSLRAKRVSTQNSLKVSNQPAHQNIIPSDKSEATPTPFDDSTNPPSATLSAASISTASSSPPSALARKQTLSSRRSSSIADISPYLSRPTEVPTSGKRLKQLALLESVADESSKMTPTLMNRDLPSIHDPSVSVPPPPTCGAQVDFRSPYDPFIGVSGPSLNAIRGANTAAMHASYHPAMADPFQVRPRSNQLEQYDPAYSVGFSGCSSMYQNQLLSLLARPPQVTSPTGFSGGPLHAPFPRSSTLGYPATPFHSVAPSNIFPSVNPHSAMQHPAPSTLPSPRPSTRGPAQSRSHLAPSSAQLLSILNSGNVVGARASISRTGPPSTGVSIHAG
jgi:mRNA-decapping enzyme subunit 2